MTMMRYYVTFVEEALTGRLLGLYLALDMVAEDCYGFL